MRFIFLRLYQPLFLVLYPACAFAGWFHALWFLALPALWQACIAIYTIRNGTPGKPGVGGLTVLILGFILAYSLLFAAGWGVHILFGPHQ